MNTWRPLLLWALSAIVTAASGAEAGHAGRSKASMVLTPPMLNSLRAGVAESFFVGERQQFEQEKVTLSFDRFPIPYGFLITNVAVSVQEVEFDDGSKRRLAVAAEMYAPGYDSSVDSSVALPTDETSRRQVRSMQGMAKVTYFDNFEVVALKVIAGASARKRDGTVLSVSSLTKDSVQVRSSRSCEFLDVLVNDGKGIEFDALLNRLWPIKTDFEPGSVPLGEEPQPLYPGRLDTQVPAGFTLNSTRRPQTLHFVFASKAKLDQSFSAVAKPDPKNPASKITGKRYTALEYPRPIVFKEDELKAKLKLRLGRDREVLPSAVERLSSNTLSFDLEGLADRQDRDGRMKLDKLQMRDGRGKAWPLSLVDGRIQAPEAADPKNVAKRRSAKYPGRKISGHVSIEVPLEYQVFTWPGKPGPGLDVSFGANSVSFKGQLAAPGFGSHDFFVGDGGHYALVELGESEDRGVSRKRYWGTPRVVAVRGVARSVVYEGDFELDVPSPYGPYQSWNSGAARARTIAVGKLKNFSRRQVH